MTCIPEMRGGSVSYPPRTRRASLYLAVPGPTGGDQGRWPVPDPWSAQTEALGAFIRSQRELARLSLRQLPS